VRITAGGLSQYDQHSYAAGYASSGARPMHFGLGTAATVNEVEIRWPSGVRQVLTNVAADQVLRIREEK
jgi:enediyne biosynthesis protein E4